MQASVLRYAHEKLILHVKSALVFGGGYIGLEMADALRHRNVGVTLIEQLPAVMRTVDREMAIAASSSAGYVQGQSVGIFDIDYLFTQRVSEQVLHDAQLFAIGLIGSKMRMLLLAIAAVNRISLILRRAVNPTRRA
jgi:hypothetical protein